MNIQKISFSGVYRLHCKTKAQADYIKDVAAREHHLGSYQSKKAKKNNIVYVVSPDTRYDIGILSSCVLNASANKPEYASKDYRKAGNAIRENIEKQILANAIDITL